MLDIKNNGKLVIKVIDFGLSREIGDPTKKIIGTHIPPIIFKVLFKKNFKCNPSIDLWCVGCFAMELLGLPILPEQLYTNHRESIKDIDSNILKNFISKCLISIKNGYKIEFLKQHPFLFKYNKKIDFKTVVNRYFQLLKNLPIERYSPIEVTDMDRLQSGIIENAIGIKYIGDNFNFKPSHNFKKLKLLSIQGNNTANDELFYQYLYNKLKIFIYNGIFKDAIMINGLNNMNKLKCVILNQYDKPIESCTIPSNVSFLQLGYYSDIISIESFQYLPELLEEFAFDCDEKIIPTIKKEFFPQDISFLYINNKLYEFGNNNHLNETMAFS
ncbi:hypothetical protein DICPUDRAFT_78437 [Dictyostelium purpureum]|uniref:Protein kinase domain-containing protein n=1 Tax=Dictyostelium purpureum TaxID=5786 RepID=F0ZJJ6_DICPU|nr:uncharacterized protein DICPUDRAFT_78437 [Dictyostelium purpureum]EGC35857.1 hypothetical protein DICPUDRAFT_78437 [Dictyostelium purpureum]|eukprot:XP_003287588.1 hypothetical protein DICPUDRAFT_78437 [Dictyostelium purpureum]